MDDKRRLVGLKWRDVEKRAIWGAVLIKLHHQQKQSLVEVFFAANKWWRCEFAFHLNEKCSLGVGKKFTICHFRGWNEMGREKTTGQQ